MAGGGHWQEFGDTLNQGDEDQLIEWHYIGPIGDPAGMAKNSRRVNPLISLGVAVHWSEVDLKLLYISAQESIRT
ncbi:hypothetical protein MACH17_38220 [Phaeobacter inhibens]|nr:hypothetical protein MACH17_38220 [Phaeobacter inhibens]